MSTSSPYPVHKRCFSPRTWCFPHPVEIFKVLILLYESRSQKFDHMIDINKSQRVTKDTSLGVVSLCNHTKRTDFVLIGCLHAWIMITRITRQGWRQHTPMVHTFEWSRSRFPYINNLVIRQMCTYVLIMNQVNYFTHWLIQRRQIKR